MQIVVGRPITVVVDAPLRRVDVVYRVRVQGDVGEQPGGEAVQARWLLPSEIDEMDGPTQQILAAAEAVRDPAGYDGHVL
ncbi:hypothetical protein GCM10025868_34230 [Angustibacter aerolatus]|uniref:NUDIX hydrolase n=1 Tax=Angustibacter aerolatus TaxID=1162965 RepID=A0ABQ6JLA0_9ACTN|nr:hypothetical protein GCM10025868_34230 [Angustibacter aerolatus]